MLHKFSWKTVLLIVCFLSSCFSMDTPEKNEKSHYYERAQYYFTLGSECGDADTEQEEKQEFAKLAIDELKEGIEKKEEDSIRCMMKFYEYGLGSIIKRDMQKYAELQKLLQEERDKKLKQTLESENFQLKNTFLELLEVIANPDKTDQVEKKIREFINGSNVPHLLKEGKKEQAFPSIGKILHEIK